MHSRATAGPHEPQVAYTSEGLPGFRSMKQLGALLLPLDYMLVEASVMSPVPGRWSKTI